MPSRYDQYRVKTGDPIGDPDYWNAPRLRDIDTRLVGLEAQKTSLDAVIDEVRAAGRARIDDVMGPLVREVAEIAEVGALLRARSATELAIATGGMTLTIVPADRLRFAAPAYVCVMAPGDPGRAMYGAVVSYTASTGELVVDIDKSIGVGVGAEWIVTVGNTTDAASDADRAVRAAVEALALRNQAEVDAIRADDAAATATQMRDLAVTARGAAAAAALDAEAARDDVLAGVEAWNAAMLPPAEVAPTTRPGGAALQAGDQWFRPSDAKWRTWDGAQWTINSVPAGENVGSVFGRTGAVDAQAGDYRGDQIARSAAQQTALAGASVEAALQTLQAADQAAAQAATPKTRTIAAGGLATGGGDLSADRTISVPKSSQAQAQAGVDDATAMTPARVADAINALVPAATTGVAGKLRLATTAEATTGAAGDIAVTPAGVKAVADMRINAVLNGAGAALDTLSELAAALGNDPNFSTTISTQIAGKLSASAVSAWVLANVLPATDAAGARAALGAASTAPATAGALGLVKIGTNLTIDGAGALSMSGGDVTAALGYTPARNDGANAAGTWAINISGSAAQLANVAPTTFGLARLGDASASAARSALNLGSAALLDVGAGANQIVQRDGAGAYPAGNGAGITAVPSQSGGRRQTVLTGPVAAGAPSFLAAAYAGLIVTTQNVSAASPLVISAAMGFSGAGSVDRYGRAVANLSWAAVAANATSYLPIAVGADGVLSAAAPTTLKPVYQWAGAPASTAGQYTYNIAEMQMYLGDGASAVAVSHVIVGHVVAGGASITSAVAYAYSGYYESPLTAWPAAGTPVSKNHNIGTTVSVNVRAIVTTAMAGYAVGDVIENVGAWFNTNIYGEMSFWSNDQACGFVPGNFTSGCVVPAKSTGAVTGVTIGSLQYQLIARRNW